MKDFRDDDTLLNEHRKKLLSSILGGAVVFAILAGTYYSLRETFERASRDFLSPYLNLPLKAAETGRKATLYATSSRTELASALLKSERENRTLRARNALLESTLEENRKFRSLLHLGNRNSRDNRPVFAEVLARAVPTWRERFVINRGKMDGIAPGNAVIASDGRGHVAMIGQIRSVSRYTAVVVTLFSEDCRISVEIAGAGEFGGMESSGNGDVPVVKYLSLGGKYKAGDLVKTSGISPRTPKGLPIGRVTPFPSGRLLESKDRIYGELKILPLIDPAAVSSVAVCVAAEDTGRKK